MYMIKFALINLVRYIIILYKCPCKNKTLERFHMMCTDGKVDYTPLMYLP
jgi:hypothetical protein